MPASSSRLPSYDDVQREHDLKASFAHLTRDHEEIQKLFKSVAAQLESTPKIGDEHELCMEWDTLFKVSSHSLRWQVCLGAHGQT